MKKKFVHIVILRIIVLSGCALFANTQAESLIDGSAESGKAKAITCTACHGPEGNSVNPLWPNIAGQGSIYLYEQLKAFNENRRLSNSQKKRQDPLMSSQAMLLSDEGMRDLAVYFESLPAAAQAVADPGKLAAGEALYRGGKTDTGAAACIACHGPTGRGNPAAGYPGLQGQHAAYTAKQLRDYASGARESYAKTEIMQEIAARLSDDDIVALASYMQGLR